MSKEKKLKVLYAASEAAPFCKTGGLGDVAGSFTKEVLKEGIDIRVILPLYGIIDEKYKSKMKKLNEFYVPLGWRNVYCGIFELKHNGLIYYFLDNEYYFKRDGLYGYFDDGERMAFYSKALLECLQYIDFEPNILHTNDWHCCLSVVFLREMYNHLDKYKNIKTIVTIHNIKFQGMYNVFVLDDITGLGSHPDARRQLMQGDSVNFMRGALNYTDFITTVSPMYAHEIQDSFYGEGLQDIFIRRRNILKGFLNGIDYDAYNPKTDKDIFVNYDQEDIYSKVEKITKTIDAKTNSKITSRKGTKKGIDKNDVIEEPKEQTVSIINKCPCDKKAENKLQLQKELGLNENKDVTLIGFVSRLTDQKGIDLINRIFDEMMCEDVQFVMLGVGDYKYENAFKVFEDRYKGRVKANIFFDFKLSKKIYAASDLILVPSLFEPCGLSQMIAMRYGALPIVRETGGLIDSVNSYNKYTKEGNGFRFLNFNAHELLFTIKEAVDIYHNDKETFQKLVMNAMNTDLSWKRTALDYNKLYKNMIGG